MMKNTITHVPSAAIARSGAIAFVMGACQPGGVATLTRMSDVFLAKPPSKPPVEKTALPTFYDNYTTRINAAGSGVSGSPPTWDPV